MTHNEVYKKYLELKKNKNFYERKRKLEVLLDKDIEPYEEYEHKITTELAWAKMQINSSYGQMPISHYIDNSTEQMEKLSIAAKKTMEQMAPLLKQIQTFSGTLGHIMSIPVGIGKTINWEEKLLFAIRMKKLKAILDIED